MVTADRHQSLHGTILHVDNLDVGGTHVYRLIGHDIGPDHAKIFLGYNAPSYRVDLVAEYTAKPISPWDYRGEGDLQVVEEIAYPGDPIEKPRSDTNTLATFRVREGKNTRNYDLTYDSGILINQFNNIWDLIAVSLLTSTVQRAHPSKHSQALQARKAGDPRGWNL